MLIHYFFIHYLKVAFRNLRKYKTQTVISILGLTTACIVFAICCYIIFFGLTLNTSYPNHERMYELKTRNFQSIKGSMKQTLGELSGAEKFTALGSSKQYSGHLLMEGDESDRLVNLQLLEADTSVWNFFSLKPLIGNVQTILNRPNSIVLYEAAAKKIGTLDEVLDRSFLIDDVIYTVTGIMKNMPINSTFFSGGDGLVFNKTNGYFQQSNYTWRPVAGVNVIVMLHKGISKDNFQTSLDNYPFVFDADPNAEYKEQVYIASIRELQSQAKFLLAILSVFGLSVLLVALFNVISFQTAQIFNRLKECAIRKLIGSGKGHLLLTFYTEIFILFVISYFLGLFLFDFLKPIFQQLNLVPFLDEEIFSGMRTGLLFSIIFGLVVTFLFCLVPVRIISRQSVRVTFMGLSEKVSKQRGRKIMLFFQMLVLLLFLSGTLIVKLQTEKVKENIWHTLSPEDKKNILIFGYENERTPVPFEVMLQKLKQSNVFDDVFFDIYPLYTYGSLSQTTIGEHEKQDFREYRVSNNFTDFFNVKIVQGRFWNENDAPDAIVVDETLAALFPDNNPLGMNIDGKLIIGVVENIQMVKENKEITQMKRPVFYSRIDKIERWGNLYVKTTAGKREEAQEYIMEIKKELYSEYSEKCPNFQDAISSVFSVENFISKISDIFFAICLILCLLGIYSAITMNTEKRRKEVAIRKVFGAKIKDIILLFSKTYILLWSGTCLLLFPVIYFAGNMWLNNFNQRISLNVFFFSGIYFSILALIFFMILFRILEVARCNPAEILKSE